MYNHQLDAFIKIADMGSFNKAAEDMFISSTAIIQQINLLEERCGFRLFIRSNHGVRLTPAGRSLYEDAKVLIRLSNESLNKARALAEASETTVRIGTSLLYKCRLLTGFWAEISEQCPELKIEIVPMMEYQQRGETFTVLGSRYDMFEGIYGSAGWKGLCRFLELERTPICCAVPKNHYLAKKEKITMADLKGEHIVMPIMGVAVETDDFRHDTEERYPDIKIVDSSYYGVDTFTMCEVNEYVLITHPVYSDIHTNLVTIPLETEYTLPYGIIYANEPTTAAKRFISAVQKVMENHSNV